MSLKDEIVKSCKICNGVGFDDFGQACTCKTKSRAFNRLIDKGFSEKTLELISSEAYYYPMILEGEPYVKFFDENSQAVEERGLSLFIHSKERGRGKTTLAHFLVYQAAYYFSDINTYRSSRVYQFFHIEDLLTYVKKGKFEACQSTWLVIDDLGNEDKSANWKTSNTVSTLQRILHYRRDKGLPTIITSNYGPSSLSLLYSGDLDSLMEIGYDGQIKGIVFREIEVGGGEDFRTAEDLTKWPI